MKTQTKAMILEAALCCRLIIGSYFDAYKSLVDPMYSLCRSLALADEVVSELTPGRNGTLSGRSQFQSHIHGGLQVNELD